MTYETSLQERLRKDLERAVDNSKRQEREERYEEEHGVGSGGGIPFAHGAVIYLRNTVVELDSNQVTYIPFDQTQIDTDGIANLEDHSLVIPVGLAGVWAYGFVCSFSSNDSPYIRATLSVNGNAWNVVVPIPSVQVEYGVSSHLVDEFAEGDTLSVYFATSADATLTPLSGGAPMILYAYYLGKV